MPGVLQAGAGLIRVEIPGGGSVSAAVAGPHNSAAILLAHGAGQGMDSPFLRTFQTGLEERGFMAVRFNFLYMEQKRKLPDPRPRLKDCYHAVADRIRNDFAPARLFLGGKSMGGRIASHLVASGYAADGLVFLGYPLHPPGKEDKMRDAHLYGLGCPMLFLSGTRDPFARRELLDDVVSKIGPGATLHWIEGGDHSLRVRARPQKEVERESLDVIQQWCQRQPFPA